MNPELTLHSLFPRSERLVTASRNLDRRRIGKSAYAKILNEEQESLFTFQQRLKCPFLESGYLNWPDRFRPLIESCSGLTSGSLTRFADTNTFYKPPVIWGEIKLDPKKFLTWFGKPDDLPWKITLPSPFHLAIAAQQNNPAGIKLFGELLFQAADCLNRQGVSFVQFNDPVIGSEKPNRLVNKELVAFFTKLKKIADLTTGYYVEMADFNQVAKSVLGLPVDYFGLDLLLTPIARLSKDLKEKRLVLGCVDSRNSLIDEPETILAALNRIFKKLLPSHALITSNTALEFVPATIARQKIEVLALVIKKCKKGGGRDISDPRGR